MLSPIWDLDNTTNLPNYKSRRGLCTLYDCYFSAIKNRGVGGLFEIQGLVSKEGNGDNDPLDGEYVPILRVEMTVVSRMSPVGVHRFVFRKSVSVSISQS